MFQRLLVERMQDGMTGLVCCRASTLGRAFAKMCGHAPKRPLVNFAVGGAGKWHTVMLQFDHRGNRLATHIFDGILIAEPVRTFHGVVHMPAPIVFTHIAQGRADATLRCHRVAAGGENFGYTSRFQTPLRQP